MACEWLRGRWSWPPLESDPVVFEALMLDLLHSSVSARSGTLTSPLCQEEVLRGGAVGPRIDEVLTLEDDGIESALDVRALLVCFQNVPSSGSSAPVASAIAAAGATAVASDEAFFLQQVSGLDAACGIIGLVHALLNADGLLGTERSCEKPPPVPDGPLSRWIDGLPPDASPTQRGRALLADGAIRALYRGHAARGQSRMPSSSIWLLLPVSVLQVAKLGGAKPVLLYVLVSIAVLLLVYFLAETRVVNQICSSRCGLCRCCSRVVPRVLDCHFICLAKHGDHVVVFDGTQAAPQSVGRIHGGAFARQALDFVRSALLPALAQPETCSIMSLRPAAS